MAWGFIMELPISQEEYDQLDAAVGPDPAGLILHTSSRTAGGMRIIDVWESKEAFDRFEQETLMPALMRSGGEAPSGPPPRQEFDVHHMRRPAAGAD